MTVPTTNNTVVFNGNGVTTVFPFGFPFKANGDIKLYSKDASGVVQPVLSGFTLTGAGSPNGGTVTMAAAPATGTKLVIAREMVIKQLIDLRNQGKFFPETHEEAFDILTMLIQQVSERVDRSVKTDITADISPDQLLANIQQLSAAAAESATASAASASAAATSLDNFDDRYLGAFLADPATDNDGQAIITGALYWNTPAGKMKAWSGSAWSFLSGDISGPASSTDTAIAIFDGASGKQVKGSAAKVNAAGDVISNGAQVGQSGTASNNFHLRNLLDGLLRLSRGNAGSLPAGDNAADVMRVKANNSVEFPGGVSSGRANTDVTASRAFGATYTNSTVNDIEVRVVVVQGSNGAIQAVVAGVVSAAMQLSTTSNYATITFTVPAGSTYALNVTAGTMTMQRWTELR